MGTSSVSSTADNDFWAGLESTIQIILDGDAVGGGAGVTAGSNDPNLLQVEQSESKFSSRSNFDLNRNSGILLVYAPERLQQEVQSYEMMRFPYQKGKFCWKPPLLRWC